jgi:transcriptional regulator with XRE-family HTH domain
LKKTTELQQKNIAGKQIKAARLRMKPVVTQEDLAGRLAARGISIGRVGITKIENGDRYLLDYELKAIAQALKVPLTELI